MKGVNFFQSNKDYTAWTLFFDTSDAILYAGKPL